MGCKRKCKKCYQIPPLASPFTVAGPTGPSVITSFIFPGKRCFKPPCSIQVQISAVSGVGSGTISLVNVATGAIIATAVVPAAAPATVTLTPSLCNTFKCGPTQFSIQGSATGTFTFTVISITNTCC